MTCILTLAGSGRYLLELTHRLAISRKTAGTVSVAGFTPTSHSWAGRPSSGFHMCLRVAQANLDQMREILPTLPFNFFDLLGT